uniref:Uncharacterized protein n=1 Tax=Sphaerodactylus townsendi TaxID=933632 RepID=A0ACB8FBF1_9SAUR
MKNYSMIFNTQSVSVWIQRAHFYKVYSSLFRLPLLGRKSLLQRSFNSDWNIRGKRKHVRICGFPNDSFSGPNPAKITNPEGPLELTGHTVVTADFSHSDLSATSIFEMGLWFFSLLLKRNNNSPLSTR